MRRILSALMLIGLTATVVAQTPQAGVPQPATAPNRPTISSTGPTIVNGAVTQLSGNVRISVNGIEIAADEATWDTGTGELALSGNVRLKLKK
jgi:lipopolysaccharide assembly outer membrane protein LptD (OstA)